MQSVRIRAHSNGATLGTFRDRGLHARRDTEQWWNFATSPELPVTSPQLDLWMGAACTGSAREANIRGLMPAADVPRVSVSAGGALEQPEWWDGSLSEHMVFMEARSHSRFP